MAAQKFVTSLILILTTKNKNLSNLKLSIAIKKK